MFVVVAIRVRTLVFLFDDDKYRASESRAKLVWAMPNAADTRSGFLNPMQISGQKKGA